MPHPGRKNVYGKNESLLMRKGATLTKEHIEQLKRLDIQSLWVVSHDGEKDMGSEEVTKIAQEVEALLDAQFEQVSHNLIMKELKRVFASYLIKKRTT
jgi:hypothetical protein